LNSIFKCQAQQNENPKNAKRGGQNKADPKSKNNGTNGRGSRNGNKSPLKRNNGNHTRTNKERLPPQQRQFAAQEQQQNFDQRDAYPADKSY
jgi:hypothetical protein